MTETATPETATPETATPETATPETATPETVLDAERADLLEALGKQRFFLRLTVRGLTDEQARLTPTASRLCLGGLIKHVAHAEQQWTNFVLGLPGGPSGDTSGSRERFAQTFGMLPDETLDGLLAQYEEVAARTDELVRTFGDLAVSQPLPPAPWFEPGARWSARRVLAHILAETAQHAGHADIIRETIDGQKSMG